MSVRFDCTANFFALIVCMITLCVLFLFSFSFFFEIGGEARKGRDTRAGAECRHRSRQSDREVDRCRNRLHETQEDRLRLSLSLQLFIFSFAVFVIRDRFVKPKQKTKTISA